MGTSRCWQEDVVQGFVQKTNKQTVAARKKAKRMIVRKIVKELKAANKHIDLQAINEQALDMVRRKRQGKRSRHSVLTI